MKITVDDYFLALQQRYRKFQMYQYCTWCGEDKNRVRFRMSYTGVTSRYCLECEARVFEADQLPPEWRRRDPKPWQSYEEMKTYKEVEVAESVMRALYAQRHLARVRMLYPN